MSDSQPPDSAPGSPQQAPIAAPEVDGAVGWLNVSSPITMANNHAIRVVDLASSRVSTLTIEGLTPPPAWSYLRR